MDYCWLDLHVMAPFGPTDNLGIKGLSGFECKGHNLWSLCLVGIPIRLNPGNAPDNDIYYYVLKFLADSSIEHLIVQCPIIINIGYYHDWKKKNANGKVILLLLQLASGS